MTFLYDVQRRNGKALTAPMHTVGAHLLVEDQNLLTATKELIKRFGDLSTVELDLLVITAAVFAADRASKRGEREDLCRDIVLNIPVFNIKEILTLEMNLRILLRDLSQDNWQFNFSAISAEFDDDLPKDADIGKEITEGKTLLFSGGLDSLAAALEFGKQPLTLVSHVTRNNVTGRAQQKLAELLIDRSYLVEHEQYFVSSTDGGPTSLEHAVESSQRTRSFVFLTLGAIVARRTGRREIVFMAENGQMAIHLPLTSGRIGAFSTHTAHPTVLAGAKVLFSKLMRFDFHIINPYVYRTKAEIVRQISTELPDAIALSTSCWKNTRITMAGATHCGACVPCFIRRIAIEYWQPDPTGYARDLWAEEISALPEDDDGRRNFADLAEFIVNFRKHPPADILCEFPELYSEDISANDAIDMYMRFTEEALKVLARYPKVQRFLN